MTEILDFVRFETLAYYTIDLIKPWNIAVPARADTIRFHFIKKGSCYIFNEHRAEATLGEPGDIVFMLSDKSHSLQNEAVKKGSLYDSSFCFENYIKIKNKKKGKVEASLLCGQIKPSDKISNELLTNFPESLVLKKKDMTALQKKLSLCLLENDPKEKINEAILVRIVESLLISILDLNDQNQTKNDSLEKKFLDLFKNIQKNYQTSIDWDFHIDKLKISRPAFFKKFRSLTGMSPNEYLNSIRMKKALVLLEATDTPIKALCSKVGFQNTGSFSKKFKSFYGKAPSEIRKKKKQNH